MPFLSPHAILQSHSLRQADLGPDSSPPGPGASAFLPLISIILPDSSRMEGPGHSHLGDGDASSQRGPCTHPPHHLRASPLASPVLPCPRGSLHLSLPKDSRILEFLAALHLERHAVYLFQLSDLNIY